jgi:hypothetical protein
MNDRGRHTDCVRNHAQFGLRLLVSDRQSLYVKLNPSDTRDSLAICSNAQDQIQPLPTLGIPAAFHFSRFVLAHSGEEKPGHADVNSAGAAGHDVDHVLLIQNHSQWCSLVHTIV